MIRNLKSQVAGATKKLKEQMQKFAHLKKKKSTQLETNIEVITIVPAEGK
jgi:hypothetical protein